MPNVLYATIVLQSNGIYRLCLCTVSRCSLYVLSCVSRWDILRKDAEGGVGQQEKGRSGAAGRGVCRGEVASGGRVTLGFVRGGFRMGEADSGGVAIDLEERHSHWRIVGRRWLDRGGDDPPDEGRGVVGFELCCWAGWMRSKFSVQNL
ncbi:hypothetical protein HPP92_020558 [Vanilla planifolia]|uniref:Uncharacterized protein n=1 Tax=Vanilla planifolia TaxID=51239 RepID=A0A835Q7G9_VANPL|nr:hypothetical protein HPP92_020558 [Vanilla planifolia]